jgi:hypothetical protein
MNSAESSATMERSSKAEQGIKVEHSAWQGWFEVHDQGGMLAA